MKIKLKNNFNEFYYKQNNYAGYLDRSERYEKLIDELHYDLFRKINLAKIFINGNVLDYGCGVGFTISALKKIGYKNILGYDISDWAVNYGQHNVLKSSPNLITSSYSLIEKKQTLIIALDVFEHIKVSKIKKILSDIQSEYLLVRIPIAKCTGGDFVLSVSELDSTHITRLTKEDWLKLFVECNYTQLFTINVGHMYDTSGVMCSMFKRKF